MPSQWLFSPFLQPVSFKLKHIFYPFLLLNLNNKTNFCLSTIHLKVYWKKSFYCKKKHNKHLLAIITQ